MPYIINRCILWDIKDMEYRKPAAGSCSAYDGIKKATGLFFMSSSFNREILQPHLAHILRSYKAFPES